MVQSEESQLPLFALDLEGVETPLVVCLSIIGQSLVKISQTKNFFSGWSCENWL